MFKKLKENDMYCISDCGEIYSKYRKKIIKTYEDKDGYLKVRLWNKDKTYTNYFVHRLVANNYIENPYNKKTVNHINGVKNDNRVVNLEWATYSEQKKHSHKVLGKRVWNRKKVICIEDKKEFGSISEAAKYYNVYSANILRSIKNGYKTGMKHFKYSQ